MPGLRRLCHGFVVTAMLTMAVSALAAPPQRTFVASTGNDSDPCTITQPCRGFAAAIVAVQVGGEVTALDSAGYGAFSIAKSVSVIAAPGVCAGVTVFAADGIAIAGGAADNVVLRAPGSSVYQVSFCGAQERGGLRRARSKAPVRRQGSLRSESPPPRSSFYLTRVFNGLMFP